MDPAGTLDSTTWAALALTLTVLGAVLSWVAWRRRGAAAGLRGLAWTLLPVAAWLTGTLRLAVAIVEDVTRWATRLVLSPTVWTGIVVAGVAVLLFVVSGAMRSRGVGTRDRGVGTRDRRAVGATEPAPTTVYPPAATPARASKASKAPKAPRRGTARHESDLDDMDDIEAILKKHGI
ncbi:hypothetical protein [Nocardioides aurantiacus]|uniref:Cellulose synthase n=1 Tax=Nocardioides aurantiacus TaxID=86796 RepID=A0A3N2CUX6_9ACTN|nr:hypothetical protein [Nocardioides aurantiacus]ROR91218.1 hypothetical protein EDD33_2084 [Nocardioides aurantiacus]